MSMRPASDGDRGMELVMWLAELLHVRIRLELLGALARNPQRGRALDAAARGVAVGEVVGGGAGTAAGDGADLGVEADVGALAIATGREVSHVSQHLVQLLAAGLLERRIVWKRHRYRLAEGVSVEVCGERFVVSVRRPDGRVCSVSALAPEPITKATDRRGAGHGRAGRAG
ncbi:MAG: winged helix-turn-helix domain-containing protein [Phycisphaerales bacterium]